MAGPNNAADTIDIEAADALIERRRLFHEGRVGAGLAAVHALTADLRRFADLIDELADEGRLGVAAAQINGLLTAARAHQGLIRTLASQTERSAHIAGDEVRMGAPYNQRETMGVTILRDLRGMLDVQARAQADSVRATQRTQDIRAIREALEVLRSAQSADFDAARDATIRDLEARLVKLASKGSDEGASGGGGGGGSGPAYLDLPLESIEGGPRKGRRPMLDVVTEADSYLVPSVGGKKMDAYGDEDYSGETFALGSL